MSINSLLKRIPEYAQDIKQNLSAIFSAPLQGLTQEQLCGIALAACYSIKHEHLLNNIRAEAKIYLEDNHFEAAKSAAIIMSMNNIYYAFTQAVENEEIKQLPSALQMDVINNSGIDQTDFEMYMLGVSILNSCDYCINVHTRKLLKKGIELAAINNIGRIVSVLKAVSDVLYLESLRNYELTPRSENI